VLLLLLTAMLAGAMTRGRVDKINTSIEMALRIAELLTPRVRCTAVTNTRTHRHVAMNACTRSERPVTFTQQHVNIP
jgi:hypothetical protein